MTSPLPAKLQGGALTEREAVADALYRAVLAFDHADEGLLRSAVTEDITVTIAGQTSKGLTELKAAVFDRVSKLITTHFLSNMRVTFDGDSKATATCSALAQHVRAGKGFEASENKFTSGGLYYCNLVKDVGLWKVSTWTADITWVDGDATVMNGE
ncbi:unnamed protein product [Clonostachys rosea]|uniref:SnoaL-like domain-containing protein n=1 Tax=Bionectria ochroleuca TaxID=29856 RepID=A0ABY6U9H7_BIOOC|nr:unnamed protein product [Clonostachys rosea]